MKLKFITNALVDGKEVTPGTVTDVEDNLAQGFIERGSAEAADGGSESTTPLVEQPADSGSPVVLPTEPTQTTDPTKGQPSETQISQTLDSLGQ